MTDPVFHIGGHSPCRTVDPEEPVRVFTEDCFSGRLDSVDGRPREVAPFPQINPMVGPIAVRGVNPGDAVAVHLQRLTPARDWGVATLSPDFGFLSGTRLSPNLQPPQAERVRAVPRASAAAVNWGRERVREVMGPASRHTPAVAIAQTLRGGDARRQRARPGIAR